MQEPTFVQTIKSEPKYEEIHMGGDQSAFSLLDEKFGNRETTYINQPTNVTNFQESETVTQVINQPIIERHQQPLITEVREQTFVENVEHPIVRTVIEKPIVREVEGSQALLGNELSEKAKYHYRQDSGMFQQVTHSRTLSRESAVVAEQQKIEERVNNLTLQESAVQEFNQDTLRVVTCSGKNHLWGLSHGKDLYHMRSTPNGMEWQFFPTGGNQFKDISVSKGGVLFAIGATDGFLYKLDTSTTRMDLVAPGETTRLRQVSASSRNKVYALAEDGSVLFLSGDHWERMGGKLKKISAGGKHLFRKTEVWGISFDDRATRWDHKGSWVPVNEELIDISVAGDNSVYAIRKSDQQLVKWDGDKFVHQAPPNSSNGLESSWRLSNISAYKESRHVYAVEAGTGNLLKMV